MGGESSLAGKNERKQERESRQGYLRWGCQPGRAASWEEQEHLEGASAFTEQLQAGLGGSPVSDPHSPSAHLGLVGQWEALGAPKGWDGRGD